MHQSARNVEGYITDCTVRHGDSGVGGKERRQAGPNDVEVIVQILLVYHVAHLAAMFSIETERKGESDVNPRENNSKDRMSSIVCQMTDPPSQTKNRDGSPKNVN